MLLTLLPAAFSAFSYSPEKYAGSSVLASGNWAKVKVDKPGLQFISNSQLSKMGFSNPEKVNVYGYGGRKTPELLTESLPDDLPRILTEHTSSGIYFFGTDHFTWSVNASSSPMKWTHQQNPYSEESFYFLSDKDLTPSDTKVLDLKPAPGFSGPVKTSFTAREVHEIDIFAPAPSGSKLFGEDFRSPSTRSFSFSLPDNTQKTANTKVVFGHLTSSSSSLKITSNGKLSAGVQSATLAPPVSSSLFMLSSTVENSFSDLPETLNLTLNFQGGGSITMARLDYIEVEWDRALQLRNGQLYFYDYARTSTRYNISGCNAKTKIWDVTDPADIKEIKYDLNGSTASFVSVGNHEYVAFDCSAGNAVAVVGSVPNQDIHALPTPDMVIISPKEFLEAANKVAEMRRRVDGFTVHVLTPSLIYNEFSSGKKDASAFRKLLKMWYDRESSDNPKIKYCLLMGRPFYDQKQQTDKGKSLGYETLPAWQTEHEATEPTSYSTDDFIGMIDDGGKAFSIQSENIRVAVGRFPVTTAAEANQAATKLINYVENPILGPWRNEVMVIADDQDNGIHLEQAKDVVSGMRSKGNGYHFDYEQLYLDAYPLEYNGLGAIYLQAKERMMNKFEEGVAIVDYIGHANPVSWGHEHLLTWADIIGFSNKKFPFLVGATCNFGCWDEEDKCGAEVMWLNPSGGIIGGMIATRTVFISANGVLNKQFSSKVFERDHENKPKSFGKMMIEAKNGYPNDDNKLRFALYGDPALRVTSPTHEVIVDAINDTDFNNIQSAKDYPELMARQKIVLKGSILNPDGSEATDFNGELQFKLWDAEKVITTLGNGEKGVVSDYNDRKNILSRGATIIKNGKWETELRIPSEIDYNYSPARFTFYAVSEDGVEANGSDERFYVYGYDTSADDDTTGPEISLFAINNPAFKDGSVIGTAANVLAEFSDESGINLSTAGIGHSISLCLDNKTYYNNILQFYSPDPENPNKGSFSYPISGLSAGEHTLTLTVWDNANNSSRATLKFNTSVNRAPEIITLSADRAPAKTEVNLLVDINSDEGATCQLDVLDLQGKILWSDEARLGSINDSKISFRWNLTNRNGVRVDRGIYIYRATVISPNGARTSKSSRIAVAAQ